MERLLDLALTNIDSKIEKAVDILINEDSHHPALTALLNVTLQCGINKQKTNIIHYNFRKANYIDLYQCLAEVNWNFLNDFSDINLACEQFYDKIYEILDTFVPKTKKHKRNYPPWFSSQIIKNINSKHRAWKKYKTHGDIQSLNEFKSLRKQIKDSIDNAYKKYCKALEEDICDNPQKFWQFINNKRKMSSIPTSMHYNGANIEDQQNIANAFADFFQNSYILPDPLIVEHNNDDTADNFYLNNFDESDVYKSLRKLKPKFTTGPDKIPAFLIRDCASVLAQPLKILFNLAIETTTFPNMWKMSKIVPVFKKGERANVENYRPITIVNNFSKVFEILLHEHTYFYMHNRLSQFQHGFIKGRSTVTNLFCITQFIAESIDVGLQTDVVYTDFSKAFDRLDHSILIAKLQNYGFSASMLEFFRSYLTHRRQYVECSGYRSVEVLATSGVPQGSNLGPLLFNIFINDIVCTLNVNCLLYADDMKLYCNIGNIEDCIKLQNDLLKVNNWCIANKLPLNVEKCNVMTYSTRTNMITFDYAINDTNINRPITFRDLGVTFDQKLSFVDHINGITSDSFRTLGFILRNASDLNNISTLKLLFCTFVRSRLEYASNIWCPSYNIHIQNLEKVQRRFLKYCCYKEDGTYPPVGISQSSMLDRFSLNSLQDRREKSQLIFLHKLLHNTVDCTEILGMLNFHVPRLSAREQSTFQLSRTRTNIKHFSPLHRMCAAYNDKQNSIDIFHCSVASIKKM